jgi:hypothetical protein
VLSVAATTATPTLATEGYVYEGEIAGGAWVDAQHLQIGDELLGADGQWQEVVATHIDDEPFEAFNLTVDQYQTYFVAGETNTTPVWVHNNCYSRLPDEVKPVSFEPRMFGAGGTTGNRDQLKRRFEANGHDLSANGEQAHHIIPWELRGDSATDSLIDRLGIDLNSLENGIALPRNLCEGGQTAHCGYHPGYTNAVKDFLAKVSSTEDNAAAITMLRGGLAKIRQALHNRGVDSSDTLDTAEIRNEWREVLGLDQL